MYPSSHTPPSFLTFAFVMNVESWDEPGDEATILLAYQRIYTHMHNIIILYGSSLQHCILVGVQVAVAVSRDVYMRKTTMYT